MQHDDHVTHGLRDIPCDTWTTWHTDHVTHGLCDIDHRPCDTCAMWHTDHVTHRLCDIQTTWRMDRLTHMEHVNVMFVWYGCTPLHPLVCNGCPICTWSIDETVIMPNQTVINKVTHMYKSLWVSLDAASVNWTAWCITRTHVSTAISQESQGNSPFGITALRFVGYKSF